VLRANAGLLIATEARVAELAKKDAPAADHGHGGGMGGKDFKVRRSSLQSHEVRPGAFRCPRW